MGTFAMSTFKSLLLPLLACSALTSMHLGAAENNSKRNSQVQAGNRSQNPARGPNSSADLEAINRKLAPRIAQAKALRGKLVADGTDTFTPAAGTDALPAIKQGIFPVQMPTYNNVTQLLPLSNKYVIVVTYTVPEVSAEIARLVAADPTMSGTNFTADQKAWMDSLATPKPSYVTQKRLAAAVNKYYGQARINTGELKLDDPTYYTITSSNDKQYANPLPAAAVSRWVTSINGEVWGGIDPDFAQYSYLELPVPMVDGKTYTITLANGKSVTFTYDELTLVSRAIHINQVGYMPDAKKYGYVGAWLLNQGPMNLPDGTTFTVHDAATGSAVLSGPVTLRAANPQFTNQSTGQPDPKKPLVSGENIYEYDFSGLTTPGNYFISISGVGRSWPFTVDNNVYAEAFYTQIRGFYHQRCGIAIGKPYSPWPRIQCHMDPVGESKYIPLFFTDQYPNNWAIFDIYNATTDMANPIVDHSGGWHDAGDWDKNLNHYAIIFDLLNLYEIKPTAFTDNQLNIPESGNNIPDILDEAEYGLLVWKKSMNDQGGVAGTLETSYHPSISDPTAKWAYSQRSRWTSLMFAAAAAQYAQLVKPFSSAKSDEYKALAIKAYGFGMDPKNSFGTVTLNAKQTKGAKSDYTVTFTEDDNWNQPFVVGAKIRLFLLTGDKTYISDLETILANVQKGFTFTTKTGTPKSTKLMPITSPFTPYDFSIWMFAGLMRPEMAQAISPTVIKTWRDYFIKIADGYVALNDAEFYRRSRGNWQDTSMQWGFDNVTNLSKILLFVHSLTGDDKYKQAALLNNDYMLGGNPTSTPWTTGIGFTYPAVLHHAVSVNDGIPDPVPGIAIYGPNETDLKEMNILWLPKDPTGKVLKMLNPALYDANGQVTMPRLRMYQAHPAMLVGKNEFTVYQTMSGAAFSYGYLLSDGWTPPDWLKNRQPRDPRILFGTWYMP